MLKQIYLTVMLAGFGLLGTAQSSRVQRADRLFDDRAYARSIKLYEQAFADDTSNVHVLRRLGSANYHVKQTEIAVAWYARLISRSECQPDDYLDYALALKETGRYEEAAYWLMRYNELKPDDERGQQLELQLIDMLALFRDSANYLVELLSINTPESELGPVLIDGKLVFCSSGIQLNAQRKSYLDNEPYLKLYEADRQPDGKLSQPRIFAPTVKSRFHDGPVAWAAQSGELFVTHNNVGESSSNRDNFVHLKIQRSVRQAGRFGYGTDLPLNSRKYSVAHPAVSADGNLLIFASDMPGGLGGTDLYLAYRVNGNWSHPENLGPEINTPGNEAFPSLLNDSVLYFASNGHGGLGGLDIFRATRENTRFRRVRNLGSPINSPGDDFGMALLPDGFKGYFASNRKGGKGKDDLYSFELIDRMAPVRFLVVDSGSGSPVARAAVAVQNLNGETVATGFTGADGSVVLRLKVGNSYLLASTGNGYSDFSEQLFLKRESTDVQYRIDLIRHSTPAVAAVTRPKAAVAPQPAVVAPQPVVAEQAPARDQYVIYHHFAQSTLTPEAMKVLDQVNAFLADHPGWKVRVESHADSRGKPELNQLLSERRARTVKNFFISRYIRPERISTEGFGETRLVNHCGNGSTCTESQHALNRRSVIIVIAPAEK